MLPVAVVVTVTVAAVEFIEAVSDCFPFDFDEIDEVDRDVVEVFSYRTIMSTNAREKKKTTR